MVNCNEVLDSSGIARRSLEIRCTENHRRYESTLHSSLDCAYVGSLFWFAHLWPVLIDLIKINKRFRDKLIEFKQI